MRHLRGTAASREPWSGNSSSQGCTQRALLGAVVGVLLVGPSTTTWSDAANKTHKPCRLTTEFLLRHLRVCNLEALAPVDQTSPFFGSFSSGLCSSIRTIFTSASSLHGQQADSVLSFPTLECVVDKRCLHTIDVNFLATETNSLTNIAYGCVSMAVGTLQPEKLLRCYRNITEIPQILVSMTLALLR